MARMTVADLQQMKRDGKKIAAGVCYDVQMVRIFEMAGVDLLSVGDSVGRTFLGQENTDDFSLEEMMVFGKAVARAAQRAVVSVDMPTAVCKAGPKAVEEAARRLKNEVGADMTKVDIREMEEELFDDVQAIIAGGLAAYPQIGFQVGEPRHGTDRDHQHVMKWCKAVEEAGASMIDLTNVTQEIYADVAKTMTIPVIGGQTGPEADGRIYVSYGLVGYRVETMERKDPPSAAKLIYDIAKKALDDVHAGTWQA